MNKIIALFTSDWHFRDTKPRCRIDNYLGTEFNKLDQVKKVQKENNNCPIFDGGDLLDNHKCSPYLEGLLLDNLPDNFFTIAGNHDLPNHRIEDLNRSSLGVLIKAGKVKHCTQLFRGYDFGAYSNANISVRGFHYGNLFHNDIYLNKDKINIALVHEFVSLEKFPGSITPQELANKLKGFDIIFCGHNHTNFEWHNRETKVINIGSMLRMDADQINQKPGFYALHEDYSISLIPFNIEDNVIDRKYIDDKNKTNENMEAFITSLNGKYEISNSFKNNLENYIKENNIKDGVKNKILGALNDI